MLHLTMEKIMSLYKLTPILLTSMLLTACGGDSSTDNYSTVSFSVSDAPEDSASEVVIAFEQLEFIRDNGESLIINVDEDEYGNSYQQIDLLQYQGKDSAFIITEEELPVGHYKNLIIHTKEGSLNYVEDNGTHSLKIPSNKLKLGRFDVLEGGTQAFTIEFDLRQSLVERGNTSSNNGYNLKPHGITIINNDSATILKGTVALSLLSSGSNCIDGEGYVYLYQNHFPDNVNLLDHIDINDLDYIDAALPEPYAIPYASTSVDPITGAYAFGFIPVGDYTAAFTCNGSEDNPIQYNNTVEIANPIEQRISDIELEVEVEKTINFNEIII